MVCTWPKSRSSPPAEKLWSSPKYLRTVTPLYSPGGAVTVSATFLPLSGGEERIFSDVESFAWYAEAVRFVVEQGIMQGIGGGLFDPNGVMNRSMLVTMLHRLAGEPGGGTASFTDVSAGIWYSDAVAWAASAELTGGYGDGALAPQMP